LLLKAPLDLPKRAEFHLAERLLKEAEELLARYDYIQASEKAWDLAQM
jgi:PaREP1/PaREP8 domain containing family protein